MKLDSTHIVRNNTNGVKLTRIEKGWKLASHVVKRQETRRNAIIDIKNGMLKSDILDKYKVDRSTVNRWFRLAKEETL